MRRFFSRHIRPFALMGGLFAAFFGIIISLTGGCASLVSYPTDSGGRPADVFMTPCPEIMATALKYAQADLGRQGALVWNLPPDTDALVWGKVARLLPSDARVMGPGDESALTINKLRLDGGRASVDVVYRTGEGVWQLATVHLEGAWGHTYRASYLQRWVRPESAPTANAPAGFAATAP